MTIDETVKAAMQAWIDARVTYWKQWGLDVSYPEADRAQVERTIRRHRRNPAVCATRMEKLTLRLDRDKIAQIRRVG